MRYPLFVLIILLLASCRSNKPANHTINGAWQSLGQGWLLEIKDSTQYAFYDITTISCIPSRQGPCKEILGSISLRGDTLSFLEGIITYQFVRTERIPNHCHEILSTSETNDPLYNFEVFATNVEEHYAFMALNEIDWNEIYTRQKAKLTDQSTDAQLYLVIEETLELLNDNHAFLDAPDSVYTAIDNIINASDHSETVTLTEQSLPEYGDFQVAEEVAKHHLQEDMTKDSWLIRWGKMTDDIGFVQIKAMWLHANLDIPQSLSDSIGFVDAYVETFHKMYVGDYIDKEVKGVNETMQKVMQDLRHMKSIVIDVRFNGGGQDAVSFEILKNFIPHRLQVAQQKLHFNEQYTRPTLLHIEGNNNAYTKPIYILTSTQTGSAAETFSLASMSMDNAQRIGSNTSGAMSTALEKKLPNGWPIAMSNEVFMDNDGNNYENIGIPPDYKLQYPTDRQSFFRSIMNDLEKDKRDILNAIDSLER